MTILLIEDNEDDYLFIRRTLAKIGSFDLVWAQNLKAGLEAFPIHQPQVILLDLNLPDATGFDGIHRLNEHSKKAAIIVLTGQGDDELGLTAIREGAQDFLTKDRVDDYTLKKSLMHSIERKRILQQLQELATVDELTGLYNRRFFRQQIDIFIDNYARSSQEFGILYIDLNRFKPINDEYGHRVGDLVLKTIGRRLKRAIFKGDMAARLGGDEFAVLAFNGADGNYKKLEDKIKAFIERPMRISGQKLSISAAVGCSIFPFDGSTAHALLEKSDGRMYSNKKQVAAAS